MGSGIDICIGGYASACVSACEGSYVGDCIDGLVDGLETRPLLTAECDVDTCHKPDEALARPCRGPASASHTLRRHAQRL